MEVSKIFRSTNLFVHPVEGGVRAEAVASAATVLPFDLRAAPRFAKIRRDRSIRAPDSTRLHGGGADGHDQ